MHSPQESSHDGQGSSGGSGAPQAADQSGGPSGGGWNQGGQGGQAGYGGQGQGGGQGGAIRVTQPLAQMHQPSQADYLDRTQLLPSSSHLTQMPASAPVRQQPDFNNMYQQNPAAGGQQQFMAPEPSAANEMGGNWSSW